MLQKFNITKPTTAPPAIARWRATPDALQDGRRPWTCRNSKPSSPTHAIGVRTEEAASDRSEAAKPPPAKTATRHDHQRDSKSTTGRNTYLEHLGTAGRSQTICPPCPSVQAVQRPRLLGSRLSRRQTSLPCIEIFWPSTVSIWCPRSIGNGRPNLSSMAIFPSLKTCSVEPSFRS